MEIDLERGYGAIPYGHGLYGYGMTEAGDADATVTPLDLDLTAQSLTGTSGASAEVEAAELVVAGGVVAAIALPPIDVLAGGKPVRAEMEAGRPGIG